MNDDADRAYDEARNERWEWARAQALKALMSSPHRQPGSMSQTTMMVNAYAEIIMTGEIPDPPPGVIW